MVESSFGERRQRRSEVGETGRSALRLADRRVSRPRVTVSGTTDLAARISKSRVASPSWLRGHTALSASRDLSHMCARLGFVRVASEIPRVEE